VRRILAIAGSAVILASCGVVGHDCLALPCPMPMALFIDVTADATGRPVIGAVVKVSGPTITTTPCPQSCAVPGYAGTYVVDIEAPGFQTAHRTITVDGTRPDCGCPTTVARRMSIMLAANP
jgi:hypothetical protein